MRNPTSRRERWVVMVLLAGLTLVLVMTGLELLLTFTSPEQLAGLIGGEGPSSERCSYQSLKSYRVSNALLGALTVCTIVLMVPISAAKTRIPALLTLVALIASFGHWYEWACRAVSAA